MRAYNRLPRENTKTKTLRGGRRRHTNSTGRRQRAPQARNGRKSGEQRLRAQPRPTSDTRLVRPRHCPPGGVQARHSFTTELIDFFITSNLVTFWGYRNVTRFEVMGVAKCWVYCHTHTNVAVSRQLTPCFPLPRRRIYPAREQQTAEDSEQTRHEPANAGRSGAFKGALQRMRGTL